VVGYGQYWHFCSSYIITRKAIIAISISGVEVIAKILLFYFHERLWNKFNFGRKKNLPEYDI
jgi:uncharacterized membrane protein